MMLLSLPVTSCHFLSPVSPPAAGDLSNVELYRSAASGSAPFQSGTGSGSGSGFLSF